MPHRRRPEKGSFGSHFDEVLKHFPHEKPAVPDNSRDSAKPPTAGGDIHDRLFESAWRKARARPAP